MPKQVRARPHVRRARRDRVKIKEPPIRVIIRTNLRNRRVELGISQRQLGESIGTTQQWIQQLEAEGGDEVPSIYQLADLSGQLDCGYHDLLVEGRFDAGVSAKDDMRKYQHRTR